MLEDYSRDTTTWGSANGSETLIKDLSTPHLVNIINWMQNGQSSRDYSKQLHQFLQSEAEHRTFFSFCTNDPIPVKQDDGQYTLSNIRFFENLKSMFYRRRTELMIKHNHRPIIRILLKLVK